MGAFGSAGILRTNRHTGTHAVTTLKHKLHSYFRHLGALEKLTSWSPSWHPGRVSWHPGRVSWQGAEPEDETLYCPS